MSRQSLNIFYKKQDTLAKGINHSRNFKFSLDSLVKYRPKMKCKDYSWLYINGSTVEATGPKKWERELKLQNIDWKSKFTLIGKISRENKLREFNFKLIHRLNVTKKELCTYGLENENKCLYCDEPDSISHTFVEYRFSQVFVTKVINWFNENLIVLFVQQLTKNYLE